MMCCGGCRFAVLLPVLVLTQAGCGRTVAVKGVVTLDGKPVPGATVLFVPEAGGDGRPASGLSDDAGQFRLTTYRPGDGAVPGTYRVVVTKTEGMSTPPDPDHASKARFLDHRKRSEGRRHRKPTLPAVYGDPETTTLRCTVPPDRPVTVELSSTPKR
jgi:hypothetical protein